MRKPELLEELLDDDFGYRINEISSSETDNFAELVRISGLNPATSFRHSDLEAVDFSNCDLGGYDFTGANLRNTIGVNVDWDETTILDGANLDGGFFSHSVNLSRQFEESEEARKEFSRLIKADVYDKSLWLNDVANDIGKTHGQRIAALRLFDQEPNVTVRNTFIYNASKLFKDRSEYRDFLTSLFARREINESSYRACLSVLAKAFNNDEIVQNILLLVLQYGRNSHRLVAVSGLVGARNFANNRTEILSVLNSQRLKPFRAYVIDTAIEHSSAVQRAQFFSEDFRERARSFGLDVPEPDFARPISEKQLVDIILGYHVSGLEPANAVPELQLLEQEGASSARQLVSTIRLTYKRRKNTSETKGIPNAVLRLVQCARRLQQDLENFFLASGVNYDFRGQLSQELSLSNFKPPIPGDKVSVGPTFHALVEVYS